MNKFISFIIIQGLVLSAKYQRDPFLATEQPKRPKATIEEVCQQSNKEKFEIQDKNAFISWNVQSAYDESRVVLGKGASGIVKQACFPFWQLPSEMQGYDADQVGTVAVKRVLKKKLRPIEIELLKSLERDHQGVPFYGCQIDSTNNYVYIVQGQLEHSFFSSIGYSFIRSLNRYHRMQKYISLVKQVSYIYYAGYIHNDIKPENMMLSVSGENAFLIDFGLTQLRYEKITCAGTPGYLSPGKCHSYQRHGSLADDLYSLIVSIAQMEAQDPLLDIYKDPETGEKRKDCEWEHTFACNKAMKANIMKVFKDQGYPEPKVGNPPTTQNTNLMGIFQLVLEYFDFNFAPLQVILIADQFQLEMNSRFPHEEWEPQPTLPISHRQGCDRLLPDSDESELSNEGSIEAETYQII